MTSDKFWRSFWLSTSALLVCCITASASLFFVHIGNIDAAAVGVAYDPNKDPFASKLQKANFAIVDGAVYKDALPLGLSQWSWDASVNWRSHDEVYTGANSIKVEFAKEWSGFGISGFSMRTTNYNSLSLALKSNSALSELYIELYDKKGTSLGRQPLGWYTPEGQLQVGIWQNIAIPLSYLVGSTTSTISAVAISTTNPGLAYVDAIQFSTKIVEHPIWTKPPEFVEPPFNPFATSTPQNLPYVLALGPVSDQRWYTLRGFFDQQYELARVGPVKGVTNDALAFFRSGRAWSNYQVQTKVDTGGEVFSLIVRMQDAENYASCAFSYSGNTVQMYHVKDGVSTMVDQSDKLHYSDYTGGTMVAGALVHGNTLTCAVDGKQVVSHEIDDMPGVGTVGVGSWDESDTASPHKIQLLRVDALVGE